MPTEDLRSRVVRGQHGPLIDAISDASVDPKTAKRRRQVARLRALCDELVAAQKYSEAVELLSVAWKADPVFELLLAEINAKQKASEALVALGASSSHITGAMEEAKRLQAVAAEAEEARIAYEMSVVAVDTSRNSRAEAAAAHLLSFENPSDVQAGDITAVSNKGAVARQLDVEKAKTLELVRTMQATWLPGLLENDLTGARDDRAASVAGTFEQAVIAFLTPGKHVPVEQLHAQSSALSGPDHSTFGVLPTPSGQQRQASGGDMLRTQQPERSSKKITSDQDDVFGSQIARHVTAATAASHRCKEDFVLASHMNVQTYFPATADDGGMSPIGTKAAPALTTVQKSSARHELDPDVLSERPGLTPAAAKAYDAGWATTPAMSRSIENGLWDADSPLSSDGRWSLQTSPQLSRSATAQRTFKANRLDGEHGMKEDIIEDADQSNEASRSSNERAASSRPSAGAAVASLLRNKNAQRPSVQSSSPRLDHTIIPPPHRTRVDQRNATSTQKHQGFQDQSKKKHCGSTSMSMGERRLLELDHQLQIRGEETGSRMQKGPHNDESVSEPAANVVSNTSISSRVQKDQMVDEVSGCTGEENPASPCSHTQPAFTTISSPPQAPTTSPAVQKAMRKHAAKLQREEQAIMDAARRSISKGLRAAAYRNGGQDLSKLFATHDRGKTGWLGWSAFRACIRRDAKVSEDQLTDKQLKHIFGSFAINPPLDAKNPDRTGHISPKKALNLSAFADLAGINIESPTKKPSRRSRPQSADMPANSVSQRTNIVHRPPWDDRAMYTAAAPSTAAAPAPTAGTNQHNVLESSSTSISSTGLVHDRNLEAAHEPVASADGRWRRVYAPVVGSVYGGQKNATSAASFGAMKEATADLSPPFANENNDAQAAHKQLQQEKLASRKVARQKAAAAAGLKAVSNNVNLPHSGPPPRPSTIPKQREDMHHKEAGQDSETQQSEPRQRQTLRGIDLDREPKSDFLDRVKSPELPEPKGIQPETAIMQQQNQQAFRSPPLLPRALSPTALAKLSGEATARRNAPQKEMSRLADEAISRPADEVVSRLPAGSAASELPLWSPVPQVTSVDMNDSARADAFGNLHHTVGRLLAAAAESERRLVEASEEAATLRQQRDVFRRMALAAAGGFQRNFEKCYV